MTRRYYTGAYVHFFETRSHWVRCFSHSMPANGVQGTVGGVGTGRWGTGKTTVV